MEPPAGKDTPPLSVRTGGGAYRAALVAAMISESVRFSPASNTNTTNEQRKRLFLKTGVGPGASPQGCHWSLLRWDRSGWHLILTDPALALALVLAFVVQTMVVAVECEAILVTDRGLATDIGFGPTRQDETSSPRPPLCLTWACPSGTRECRLECVSHEWVLTL